jgi:2',3'-cyclic-nucleotide 2'-phosphodiesterase
LTELRILFIGDIVGKPGRNAVQGLLRGVKEEHGIGFTVANGENAAGGMGLTPVIAQDLLSLGIDVLTSGNHIWSKREVLPFLDQEPRLLRPANYPSGVPGRGAGVFSIEDGTTIGILNLEGRVFMKELDCPFRIGEMEVERLLEKTPVVLVDFHAEATSEKRALGWFFDGRVSAVFGTHTHVQTSDEVILDEGTAYITDAGMTGPLDSVIGVRKEIALERFLTQIPGKFDVATGRVELQGVVLRLDAATGRATAIERIRKPLE